MSGNWLVMTASAISNSIADFLYPRVVEGRPYGITTQYSGRATRAADFER
jgi:hypothetical protein